MAADTQHTAIDMIWRRLREERHEREAKKKSFRDKLSAGI